MSARPDLSLAPAARAAFLRAVCDAGEPVAYAVAGADGYPVVGLAVASLDAGGEVLRFGADGPPDAARACVIVERGATYDDITAVIARGEVRDRALVLDDLVTFAFAEAARGGGDASPAGA